MTFPPPRLSSGAVFRHPGARDAATAFSATNAGRATHAALRSPGTEFPLIIQQTDLSFPVFDTTRLHASMAVDFILRRTAGTAERKIGDIAK